MAPTVHAKPTFEERAAVDCGVTLECQADLARVPTNTPAEAAADSVMQHDSIDAGHFTQSSLTNSAWQFFAGGLPGMTHRGHLWLSQSILLNVMSLTLVHDFPCATGL